MNIEIKIDEFEGPLDLLLHLIKESKMDIFNLKIEIITDQYLDYIHKMEEMNLDIASSYLVMAAELIEMKSRLLLPKKQEEEQQEEEESFFLIDEENPFGYTEGRISKELTKDSPRDELQSPQRYSYERRSTLKTTVITLIESKIKSQMIILISRRCQYL